MFEGGRFLHLRCQLLDFLQEPAISPPSTLVPRRARTACAHDGVCTSCHSLLRSQLHIVIVVQKTLSHITTALKRFNGVSNVLTCSLNSKMARSTVLAPDVLDDRDPVHRAGAYNVRVGFAFWDEEHLVARVQSVALRQSEHETASLEVAQTLSDDSDARGMANVM